MAPPAYEMTKENPWNRMHGAGLWKSSKISRNWPDNSSLGTDSARSKLTELTATSKVASSYGPQGLLAQDGPDQLAADAS